MIKTKSVMMLMGAVVFFGATAKAQAPAGTARGVPSGKIAVVDSNRLPEAIHELKAKLDELNRQFAPLSQRLEAEQKQIVRLTEELNKKVSSLPAAQVAKMGEEYENRQRQLRRDTEAAQADYQRARDKATKPVADKIGRFLQAYADQRNIVLVLDVANAGGLLLFANNALDITNDLAAEYNRANPATPTAAPK